ncbi:30S ribosomal protein S19 [ANME-1 cluster archaeon GoMg1]|uniref:Small ribosomal subunit protein uS19 n=1 Tax=Candidatus Methanophagaceae archaeon ANME-1 ERB6 TaxID=2759912 RepID=A0A7G9YWZ2_9EURY|nr:30S ribosomal protein S19 [ANME-1 cluster archaeon GoMg1]QNO52526.1 30S ribosomal protein S19 [Methanosarcinales archaeon ANME-1 ERB6]
MAKKKAKSKTTLKKKEEEFMYRGYTLAKLKKMSLGNLADLLGARQRRKLKRELRSSEEKLLERSKTDKESVKTHLRDAIILPSMVGKKIGIHNGKSFEFVEIKTEMIGHYLGEFALTRKKVLHGSAGVGATRSSKYVPLK